MQIDWQLIRKEFFNKCVDIEYFPVERKKLNIAPDDLFDWFKKEIDNHILKSLNEKTMTLKELSVGDTFYSTNDKTKRVFKVIGRGCLYNTRAGTSTRVCLNTATNKKENKHCRLQIIKL